MLTLRSGKQLVQNLGGVPLAITQVAAYMVQTGVHVDKYLAALSKGLLDTKTELDIGQKEPGAAAEAKTQPVIATWEISFETVEKQHRGVSDLLKSFAFLSDSEVSVEVIARGGNRAFEGKMDSGIFFTFYDVNTMYDLLLTHPQQTILKEYSRL
jgi:hypothetical protein